MPSFSDPGDRCQLFPREVGYHVPDRERSFFESLFYAIASLPRGAVTDCQLPPVPSPCYLRPIRLRGCARVPVDRNTADLSEASDAGFWRPS